MSGILLVLLIVAGLLLLFGMGWGLFWFLAQAGVVVQKAMEPPTTDNNNYSMNQGREVKGEDQ
jgi:flagellar basal body-associated protein FliL